MVTTRSPHTKLLSIPEAANFLGLGEATIRQAVDEGQLPAVRLGTRQWIPIEALRKALAGSL